MIRKDHPLRFIKKVVDKILKEMDDVFDSAYAEMGRPSIPPEQVIKALLLMLLYSVRSERQLVERIHTDILFRWFLDMSIEENVFNHSIFSVNRERIAKHDFMGELFKKVLTECQPYCSDDHFSVDGTLIESAASIKSFTPKPTPKPASTGDTPKPASTSDTPKPASTSDTPKPASTGDASTGGGSLNSFKSRNASVDFRGQKRGNETHQSVTDPESRLYRKGLGTNWMLAHLGHVMVENRNGIIVATNVSAANGTAEKVAAVSMVEDYKLFVGRFPSTLGADKGYDSGEFLLDLEQRGIDPHVAMRADGTKIADPEEVRKSRRDRAEARSRMKQTLETKEYEISQKARKKVEEPFGWFKTIAGLSKSRWFNRWKLDQQFQLTAATYNLVRLKNLATKTS